MKWNCQFKIKIKLSSIPHVWVSALQSVRVILAIFLFVPFYSFTEWQSWKKGGAVDLWSCFIILSWSNSSFWLSFTPRTARALKYSRLSQHGLRQISMKCILFGTISGPYLDLVWAMFGLALLPDQPEFWNFHDEVIMI